MKKTIVLIAYLVMAVPAFTQDATTELIPNSELHVSFPSDWTFVRSYIGGGKHISLNVNLPKGDRGGVPAYPEFDFEFFGSESGNEKLKSLLGSSLPDVLISGVEAKEFKEKSEVYNLRRGFSHSYSELTVTGYVVPINNGHLVCMVTTQSNEEGEHAKYVDTLETYCASAVASGLKSKSPNRLSNKGAEKRASS